MNNSQAKWALCGLLFLATTLNYLDRQTMAVLGTEVIKDLGLNNESLGWLFAIFYYSYTFAQFGVGAVLDRTNLRWAYGIGVIAWSLAAAGSGLAAGFAALFALRLMLGVTESVNWPAAIRVVSRSFPAEQRALGNGFFTSGTSVGALIAPALILGISQRYGWRAAFVSIGALGLLWFLAWIAYTSRSLFAGVWRDDPAAVQRKAPSFLAGYKELLAMPAFWRVFAVTVVVNPCLYYNANWLPTFLVQQRGLIPGSQLSLALTPVYAGLALGQLGCGFAVLGLMRRGFSMRTARRLVFGACSMMLAVCGIVPWIPGPALTVTALVIVNIGSGAWISMYLTMAQEVSHRHVSTAAGLLGGFGSLAGALAMWAVGVVTQRTGSFNIPMAAVSIAALLAAVAGWFVTRNKLPLKGEISAGKGKPEALGIGE